MTCGASITGDDIGDLGLNCIGEVLWERERNRGGARGNDFSEELWAATPQKFRDFDERMKQ